MSPHVNAVDPEKTSQLQQELLKTVPDEILLSGEEAMRPFECDALSMYSTLVRNLNAHSPGPCERTPRDP